MGYVVIISLPMILLVLIIALSCYLFGRARGRTEVPVAQYYGPPAPPPRAPSHDPEK